MSSNISLLLKVPKPNNVFCIPEKRVKLPEILIYDIRNFSLIHPELSNGDAAEAFLDKWGGYKAKYSVDDVKSGFKIVME